MVQPIKNKTKKSAVPSKQKKKLFTNKVVFTHSRLHGTKQFKDRWIHVYMHTAGKPTTATKYSQHQLASQRSKSWVLPWRLNGSWAKDNIRQSKSQYWCELPTFYYYYLLLYLPHYITRGWIHRRVGGKGWANWTNWISRTLIQLLFLFFFVL